MHTRVFAAICMSILMLSAACRCKHSTNSPTTRTQPASTMSRATPDGCPKAATSQAAPAVKRATPLTEDQKIEALIAALSKLKGATFIRNGSEHDVDEAVEHMRRKWAWKKDEIKTADDFIRIAATGSSMTGKPYTIRLADGREFPSANWFRKRLAEINHPEK